MYVRKNWFFEIHVYSIYVCKKKNRFFEIYVYSIHMQKKSIFRNSRIFDTYARKKSIRNTQVDITSEVLEYNVQASDI